MSLLDDIMQDSGLDDSQRATVERRMNGILAAAERIAGRSLLPGEWSERHRPINGRVILRNPPIRYMITLGNEYDSESGLVFVGTDADVTIEYEGGPETLPADLYMALLALVQGDSKPGIISEQLYDVGSVTFASAGDPTLGHYCDLFRKYGLPAVLPRTLLSSERL